MLDKAHDQEALRHRALAAGLAGRKITILHQDADGLYDFAENVPVAFKVQDIIGSTDERLWEEPFATSLKEARLAAAISGEPQQLELEIRDGSGRHVFEVQLNAEFDSGGAVSGTMLTYADVSEGREREQALTSLMREVSHRSKNLLAIVQAVAMQTAHHSGNITEFLAKFRGRLQALASTQDLVTESNWRGTLFHSLVLAQLGRLGQIPLRSVRISGDNPLLGPNAALHVGLAIHELGANALMHGALAHNEDAGTIEVSATVQRPRDRRATLVVEWVEHGIEPGEAPRQPHFGTLVLERIVPLSVGGTAAYRIEDGTLHYRLEVPDDQFEQ